MNSKQYIYIAGGVVVLVCVVWAGFYLMNSHPATPGGATAPTGTPTGQPSHATVDPLNATYTIDGAPVTLVQGKAQQPAAPGLAENITTQVFGQPTYGDMNGDGIADAAVMLVQDGAGSGTFYYAAVAVEANGSTTGTNAILLGDRIAPDTMQIANGILTVNYADRKLTDPMSTPPSIGVSKYLVVANGVLYDTPIDIYPLPSGMSWGDRYGTTTLSLAGIKIVSAAITNITDLAAKATPFENYYKTKLMGTGWLPDNALAAGGPGADVTAYKKGSQYIVLEYSSIFKNITAGAPEKCPCDMTFSIFAGASLGK